MPENLESMVPFADIDLDEMSVKLIKYLRKELGSESVDYLEPLTRLTGGFENLICRFQLRGVDEHPSKPLVIRIYPEGYDSYQPLKEGVVHNTMADLGYPVPAVYFTCTDMAVLGNIFMIMDYCKGESPLDSDLPFDQMADTLGNLHAKMHNIDAEPIVQKLIEVGWETGTPSLDGRLKELHTQVNSNSPWLNEATRWLVENRPNDPETLSVCHCDFHPGNLLYKDEKVQAILDWGGFQIADPAMDVAYSTFLITIPGRIFFPGLDAEDVIENYYIAYRKSRPLDETNIAYYSTIKGVHALLEGTQGHTVWGAPDIVKQILASIYDTTGIEIEMPS